MSGTSTRGISDSRASQRALLEQLSQRRKERQDGASPQKKRTIIGLSDSDDSAHEDDASQESLEDDSEYEAAAAAPAFAPPSQALLSRLHKAGSIPKREATADDLTAQLGGLGLGPNSGSAPPAAPKPPPPPCQRPAQPPPQRQLLPAVAVSSRPVADMAWSAAPAARDEGGSSDEGCLILGDRGQFKLDAQLSAKLYPHQVVGVRWLWGLHQVGAGGILADDMGLGKTMQVSAFLAGLLRGGLIRRALVLAPKTLLAAWRRELGVCGAGAQVHEFFGTKAERGRALGRVLSGRGVLLTTYGMVQHNSAELAEGGRGHDPDEGPLWDVMVMDEGHKLKNPKMQLRGHVEAVPVRCRLVISGTPIQNNLMEMHALFDLVQPGLLGDAKTFKDRYERRINIGNDKHATQGERERGAAAAAALRQTVAPFMLRREKKDVLRPSSAEGAADPDSAVTMAPAANGSAVAASAPGSLGHKNDLVIWLRLQSNQRTLYESFLNSDAVKAVLNQTSSALAALTVLKKICDHPALLSERAQQGIISGARRKAARARGGACSSSEDGGDSEEADYLSSDEEEGEWCSSDDENGGGAAAKPPRRKSKPAKQPKCGSAQPPVPPLQAQQGALSGVGSGADPWAGAGVDDGLLAGLHTAGFEASCKTVFVMALLRDLVGHGHRTLVFSQSRVMLDILQAAVAAEGWRFNRIDGGVASAAERQARVEAFQTDPSIPIFLLTSQVGGLGLTLTAADRVIIVDPAWNPSTDNQAVDRAYRIGQRRDVVVYRLISCGTVEDKIYRKQVYKGGLSRAGTEEGEQFRYFSAAELRDLFRLDPGEAQQSATQRQLAQLHGGQRRETPELRDHLRYLTTVEGFAGVSDHDLLYSKKEAEGGVAAAAAPFAPTQRRPSSGGGGGGGFASPQRRPRAPKVPSGKAATSQGWSGGGGLSDMFSRVMTLGGGGNAAASAVPPGAAAAATAAVAAPGLSGRSPDAAAAQLAELQGALAKQQEILARPVLLQGLADGGARVYARAAQLEAQIAELQRLRQPAPEQQAQQAAQQQPARPPVEVLQAAPEQQQPARPPVEVLQVAPERQQPPFAPVEVDRAAAAKPPPPTVPLSVPRQQHPPGEPAQSPFQRLRAGIASFFSPNKQQPVEGDGETEQRASRSSSENEQVGRSLFGATGGNVVHPGSLAPVAPPCTAAPPVPPPPPPVSPRSLAVKALKKRLFYAATALAEAERNGAPPERTAQLRAAAEELNAEYRRAKAGLEAKPNLV